MCPLCMCAAYFCVRVSFLCFKSTTARPTERYVTLVLSSSRYGYCWSSGASLRSQPHENPHTEITSPFSSLPYMHIPPRTQLCTHARDVKTADPPLLHRSLLLASSSFSPSSSLFLPFFPSLFSPFPPPLARRLPLDYLTDKGYVNGDIRAG